MKQYILAAVAAASLGFSAVAALAADEGSWTGALICNKCGAKQADEAAALKHKTSCALGEKCAASGFQLIVGDKHYKLDEKSNKEAKEYLEKLDDKSAGAKVTITGKMEGDEIEASSIKAADAK